MVLAKLPLAASLRLRSTRSLATATSSIGATKVAMSIFEQDKFINYQRIEDNLVVVRQRYVAPRMPRARLMISQIEPQAHPLREGPLRPLGQRPRR